MSSVRAEHPNIALCKQLRPDITIVEVYGAIDACNADRLSDGIGEAAGHGRPLVVDLGGVHFFGGDGFHALAEIGEKCWRTNMRWVLVPSDAVDRLLRIADRDCGLPTAETVTEAVRRLTMSGVIA